MALRQKLRFFTVYSNYAQRIDKKWIMVYYNEKCDKILHKFSEYENVTN